jgi:hypothetical protein
MQEGMFRPIDRQSASYSFSSMMFSNGAATAPWVYPTRYLHVSLLLCYERKDVPVPNRLSNTL